ncbi:Gamma-interferon-inducible lysosomal thiol reductase [Aphelenchoides bicaudatus]|nr:Gamma-interferon-inducible lysosomal thiol reductase [Aphelenchoides bicaudatus]
MNFVFAFLIAFTFLLVTTFAQKPTDCSLVPPALWCQNDTLAEFCGLTDQCQRYEKAMEGKKLKMTLLYETLCPDSQAFVKQQLKDVHNNFVDYIDFEWVPFGNAHVENGTIVCQHGEPECIANKFESCVIAHINDPFELIYCLEGKFECNKTLDDASEECYKELKIETSVRHDIDQCFSGSEGQELQVKAAERTKNVWPQQHRGVPYVLFNDIGVWNIQYAVYNISSGFVCSYLTGKKPKLCNF